MNSSNYCFFKPEQLDVHFFICRVDKNAMIIVRVASDTLASLIL
jgi:hypothetical protein